MLFFGVNGGFGVVPAKQFGPSLMPSATSYLSPTETIPTDTQGTRNPGSTSTPDQNTITATSPTSPTDPVYGTSTQITQPVRSPTNSTPPPSTTPVYGTGTTQPTTQPVTDPVPTSTPSGGSSSGGSSSVDVGPTPSCPADTMFDASSHTCIGQGAGTFGATYPTPSYVGPTIVTTSGPTVVVDPTTTPPSMIPGVVVAHRRKRNVIFWLGVGMIALSAIVVARS